jgi:hypothetical protein
VAFGAFVAVLGHDPLSVIYRGGRSAFSWQNTLARAAHLPHALCVALPARPG